MWPRDAFSRVSPDSLPAPARCIGRDFASPCSRAGGCNRRAQPPRLSTTGAGRARPVELRTTGVGRSDVRRPTHVARRSDPQRLGDLPINARVLGVTGGDSVTGAAGD